MINTHREPRPYLRCDSCDASFKYKSKLTRHILTHTKVKQYICKICSSSFSLNYNLQVHLRIHLGIKPFQCPVPTCSKSFTQSNNLTVHVRIHRSQSLAIPVKKDLPDSEKSKARSTAVLLKTEFLNSDKETDISDREFSLINSENNQY